MWLNDLACDVRDGMDDTQLWAALDATFAREAAEIMQVPTIPVEEPTVSPS